MIKSYSEFCLNITDRIFEEQSISECMIDGFTLEKELCESFKEI
jgi:hypothetical protein